MEDDPQSTSTSHPPSPNPARARSRRRPWQFDWKRPQFTEVKNSYYLKDTGSNNDNHSIVVGLATAQISGQEARRILGGDSDVNTTTSSAPSKLPSLQEDSEVVEGAEEDTLKPSKSTTTANDDDDGRYLLSVTLLAAAPASQDTPVTTATSHPPASEVLLEIIDTAPPANSNSDDSNDDTDSCMPPSASIVFAKRLTWPETAVPSKRQKQTKDKNIFSVFKPLFGIDEEDQDQEIIQQDAESATKDYSSATNRTIPASDAGIVSATLCRRKSQSETSTTSSNTASDSAVDLIALMNLGMPVESGGAMKDDTTSNTGDDLMVSSPRQSQPTTTTAPGDLFLVCVSHSGKVFVYNPWTLLNDGGGAEKKHPTAPSSKHNNTEDDDDDFSQFFLGNDLFQTLQQTWKPLSEPIATIRLSVFEHDHGGSKSKRQNSTKAATTIQTDQGTDEHDDDESVSVLSASSISQQGSLQLGCPPPSPASTTAPSVVHTSSSDQGQWATSGTTHHQYPRHHHHQRRSRRKPLVDPFLWNPLLEAATLHDRTHSNSPISVSNAGDSYLIVTGKGVPYGNRRKKLRERLRQLEQQRSVKTAPPTTPLQRNEAPLGNDDDNAAPTSDRKSREWWESSRSLSEKLLQESKRKKNRAKMGSSSSQHSIQAGEADDTHSASSSVASATSMSHHYHHTMDNDRDKTEGGFVTFLSSGHWSESRTLFLPFVPISVSHIYKWNGMELIMVLGKKDSALIRIDASGPRAVPVGEATPALARAASMEEKSYSGASPHTNDGQSGHVVVKKFQILSIENPIGEESSVPHRLLCGTGNAVEPPSLLELYLGAEEVNHSPKSKKENALVLCKSLSHCTDRGTVVLHHSPSQFAKIVFSSSHVYKDTVWAQNGQGWSLLGRGNDVFLICWEGSTPARGSCVHELPLLSTQMNPSLLGMATSSQVLPLYSRLRRKQSPLTPRSRMQTLGGATRYDPRISMSAMVPLPFSTPYETQALSRNIAGEFKLDVDVIMQAMKDLSNPYPVSNNASGTANTQNVTDRRQLARMSHRQRSERLLQHCSSWTQLQDTLDDRVVLERQEPVLNLRFGSAENAIYLYGLRQLVVNNGAASPFQQVLAWLAKGGDFFTAASVALDLLQDGETLYHLWKHADIIDEQEEESKLDGLLDGIMPIQIVDQHSPGIGDSDVYVVHLADMTVGCLIKGGSTMAQTLQRFLRKNEYYDPARACLMLAATTARIIGDAIEEGNSKQESVDDLLWPVRCLLQIGIARNYLATALMLLNVTIPDEVRNRSRSGATALSNLPALTEHLVGMIVESDPIALDMLLDLADEETGAGYWKSLDHETQLILSLIEIKSSFPIIQNPEIRAWVREELNLSFKQEVKLSTLWLQKLAVACLTNSGCELKDFEMDDYGAASTTRRSSSFEIGGTNNAPRTDRAGRGESLNLDDDDGLGKLRLATIETRNALATSTNGYGIDNDLLIPCLLLLETRNAHWLPSDHEFFGKKMYAPTQALLEAACYLAGRRPNSAVILTAAKNDDPTDEKPFLFAEFDSKTAMKLCYMSGNVSAGANLIGGKNGFVLHLCQILQEGIGLSIRDVERFVLSDDLSLSAIEDSKREMSSFELDDGRRKLLLLLEEHVLSVKTFGEFETVHMRGRVDPVFAASSVFRSWLALSYGDRKSASNWLCQWLRRRLEIGRFAVPPSVSMPQQNGSSQAEVQREPETTEIPTTGSRHRLACAAIARSLVWPPSLDEDPASTTESPTLAVVMDMEATFVIEICEACVGLVESVPPAALKAMKTLAC